MNTAPEIIRTVIGLAALFSEFIIPGLVIASFGKLAGSSNSLIVPTNVADMASVTAILKNAFDFADRKGTES